MKIQKIKISLVIKILFICIFTVCSALLMKYYNDVKLDLNQTSRELNFIIFLNDKVESKEVLTAGLESLNCFNVAEYVDKEKAYQKALALNPELLKDIELESKYYPAYAVANELKIKDRGQFNDIIVKVSGLEYVSEIGYDQKAFDLFIKTVETLSMYEKIFINLMFIVLVLFIIKATLYVIYGKVLIILTELLYGTLAALTGYASIALVASISNRQFFVLDWHMLFVLIPLGCVLSFMTKESNV